MLNGSFQMQAQFNVKNIERIVAQVQDPELPMVTIQDLGILRRNLKLRQIITFKL